MPPGAWPTCQRQATGATPHLSLYPLFASSPIRPPGSLSWGSRTPGEHPPPPPAKPRAGLSRKGLVPGILRPAAVVSAENRAGVLGSVRQVPSFIKFLLHSSISQLPAAHTYPQRGEEIFSLLRSWSFCEYLTFHRTVVWFLFFPQGFYAPDKFTEESSCSGTWILEKKKAQKNITWVSVRPLCQGPGFRAHPPTSTRRSAARSVPASPPSWPERGLERQPARAGPVKPCLSGVWAERPGTGLVSSIALGPGPQRALAAEGADEALVLIHPSIFTFPWTL